MEPQLVLLDRPPHSGADIVELFERRGRGQAASAQLVRQVALLQLGRAPNEAAAASERVAAVALHEVEPDTGGIHFGGAGSGLHPDFLQGVRIKAGRAHGQHLKVHAVLQDVDLKRIAAIDRQRARGLALDAAANRHHLNDLGEEVR